MTTTPLAFKKIPTLKELQDGFPGLQALFFDMDGTLFNTEEHHAQALFVMAHKYQIKPPHSPEMVHELLVGKADHLVFDIIKDWEGVPKHWSTKDFVDEKTNNLIEILKQIDPHTFFPPEILSVLKEAKKENLYLALVTSSEKVITEILLKMTGIYDYFNLILTRDDCPTHKPDPWPYLKALDVSGIHKSSVLIFEDSHVGLSAAQASGAHVIKVEWFIP